MQGINLSEFQGFTQKRSDFCLFACIQNILFYFKDKNKYNQFQLAQLFRKYINPNTDHPYFKYFAKYFKEVIPKFRGKYSTYKNSKKYLKKIKMMLDKDIPVMISLKSHSGLAHIIVVCRYYRNSLLYFDPDSSLPNNFIIKTCTEILKLLKGSEEYDLFIILQKKKRKFRKRLI